MKYDAKKTTSNVTIEFIYDQRVDTTKFLRSNSGDIYKVSL